VRSAGWLGIAGGLLAAFAGWRVLQASDPTRSVPTFANPD
jgi:hypothetical protein